MTTVIKTATILICATLILTGCGDEPATNPTDTQDSHDTHDHDGHDDHNAQDANTATSQAVSEAQALIDAATKYINDNKLELAEKSLAQLDNLRADLPDSLTQKIDTVKAALAAAKAATGKIEIPKLN